MKQSVYKLKTKKIGQWELPIKDILLNKIEQGEDLGGRRIKYLKGGKSIWADDLPEFAVSEKVWFIDGFLFVPKSDKNLTYIVENHPWNNLHFSIQDTEADAKAELQAEKAKDEVINLISNSDKEKIIATAMAIFGHSALSLTQSEQELKLRKYAKEKPVKLLQELKSKTYESKYIAALAFGKGVVRTNFGKTAIIWNNETEGVILTLARGESGISKLGELLSKRTDESEILLTAIGENLDKIAINLPKKAVSKETDKDAEIKHLKAQLATFKEGQKKTTQITELQKLYKEKFEKEVPLRFKNNEDWIKSKLTE